MLFKRYKIKSRIVLKRVVNCWDRVPYYNGCVYWGLNKCNLTRHDPIFIFCSDVASYLFLKRGRNIKYSPTCYLNHIKLNQEN